MQLDFTLEPQDLRALANLCGNNDSNIELIAKRFAIHIYNRGHAFRLVGKDICVYQAQHVITSLYNQASRIIDAATVHLEIVGVIAAATDYQSLPAPKGTQSTPLLDVEPHILDTQGKKHTQTMSDNTRTTKKEIATKISNNLVVRTPRKHIQTRGKRQRNFIEHIRQQSVCFGVGPAGTGKTYLAVASAIEALINKQYERIIITRPAVEAGEKLGFLPGDFAQKVDPYLRPVFDALYDTLGLEYADNLIAKGIIEVAPLAFMRGRSFNNAFILLDEAQNTTIEQMKMFLTRMGYGSQIVVTGDPSQKDIDKRTPSGLSHALEILATVPQVAITTFIPLDIVRHPLVQSIVYAYEKYDHNKSTYNI